MFLNKINTNNISNIEDNQKVKSVIAHKIKNYWHKNKPKEIVGYKFQKMEFDNKKSMLYVKIEKKVHINIVVDLDSMFLIVNVKKSRVVESRIYHIALNHKNLQIIDLVNVCMDQQCDQLLLFYLLYFLFEDVRELKNFLIIHFDLKILQFIKRLI